VLIYFCIRFFQHSSLSQKSAHNDNDLTTNSLIDEIFTLVSSSPIYFGEIVKFFDSCFCKTNTVIFTESFNL